MSKNTCETCRYWQRHLKTGDPSDTGKCYRYPSIVIKNRIEWCGEHAENEEVAAARIGAMIEADLALAPQKREAAKSFYDQEDREGRTIAVVPPKNAIVGPLPNTAPRVAKPFGEPPRVDRPWEPPPVIEYLQPNTEPKKKSSSDGKIVNAAEGWPDDGTVFKAAAPPKEEGKVFMVVQPSLVTELASELKTEKKSSKVKKPKREG